MYEARRGGKECGRSVGRFCTPEHCYAVLLCRRHKAEHATVRAGPGWHLSNQLGQCFSFYDRMPMMLIAPFAALSFVMLF